MNVFEPYLARWKLTVDGAETVTPYSRLLPVRVNAAPAMLKIAVAAEEARGADVMEWWDAQGAARVLARDANAILLERAVGSASLVEMSRAGGDDEAAHVICDVAAKLHARGRTRATPPPSVVPLSVWFAALDRAVSHGGVFVRAAAVARELLAEPRDSVVLHGDLHHQNVLDFGPERGWLAIDPKGLIGERAFDFANTFCNPDVGVATAPGRVERLLRVVAAAATLDERRLLQWVFAFAALSAAWDYEDNGEAAIALCVATIADALLM